MANPARGETQIRIGRRDYTLAYDLNVLCEIEAALGDPMADVAGRLEAKRAGVRDLRALLWGGLQRHHPMPIEQVGELLQEALTDPATGRRIGNQLTEAIAQSFPPAQPAATPATPTPATQTGRRSTARQSKRGSTPRARGG